MLNIELHTSELVNPIIRDPSIRFGSWIEKVAFGWLKLNSNVFFWFCMGLVNKYLRFFSY